MKLTVTFLPGVPEKFQKTFQVHSNPQCCKERMSFEDHSVATMQVQVAHLEPDEITLVGEGVFPRIGFDLPSQLLEPGSSEYSQLREMAYKSTLTMDTVSNAVRCCSVYSAVPVWTCVYYSVSTVGNGEVAGEKSSHTQL